MFENSDELEILQGPLRFLRIHQLWPPENEKITDPKPLFRLILVLSFCAITIVGTALHIAFMFKHPHTIIILDLMEDLVTIFVHVIVYYTVFVQVRHFNELSAFMADLTDYATFGKPPGIDEVNARCNYFTYIFYGYGLSGTAVFSVTGLLEKSECDEMDVDHTRACGFLLPVRFPLNLDRLDTFAIAWLAQSLSLNLLLTSGIVVMTYLYSIVEIFNTKIAHLNKEIEKLGDHPETARERINFCVRYHVKIIQMTKSLNHVFGTFLLYHQMLVTALESLIGIQFLMSFHPKYLVHGSGWLVSLTVPCYAGQTLLDASSKIPLAIYSSHWHDLDNEHQKDLLYMLMCANNYLVLDKDGYGPVDLSNVQEVVHNIYSILMLIYSTMS